LAGLALWQAWRVPLVRNYDGGGRRGRIPESDARNGRQRKRSKAKIATQVIKEVTATQAGSALPEPVIVVKSVAFGALPVAGLFFVFGKLALGLSVLAGALISLSVGVMLLLLVGKLFTQFVSTKDDTALAKFQFAAFMVAKFVLTAALCIVLLSIKGIAIFGVMIGLLVGQSAVVLAAIKSSKATP